MTSDEVQQQPTEQTARRRATIAAPVDVFENAEEYLLVSDLPGVTQDGLHIELDRGELRVAATRNLGDSAREYRRAFTVPDGIDPDAVRAELRLGVLYVHLPKPANVKPRRIKVTAGP
jgi:HSP20 family protein